MQTDVLGAGNTVNSNVLNNAVSAAANGASSSSVSAAQTQLSSDINFFLKLLTTQLQNQDPSAPLDTNQFTQQIAQYSSVQQQVNTNTNLEKLLAQGRQSGVTTAVGYIGKEIESRGNSGSVVGGQGAFSYILPQAANSVEIIISNANGQEVFRGNGNRLSGRNIVVWDGINSANGNQEPDGTYKIIVNALDGSGKPIKAETRSVGIVSGVETDAQGNTLLSAGDSTVNFNDVLAVRAVSRANL